VINFVNLYKFTSKSESKTITNKLTPYIDGDVHVALLLISERNEEYN